MFFAPGLGVRPEGNPPAARHKMFGLRTGLVGLAAGLSMSVCAPAEATVLSINSYTVAHVSGLFLPQGFPASVTANTAPSLEAVNMMGMIGPVTRQQWVDANVSTIRWQIHGGVLDGVEAGDDVVFAVGLSIHATRGSVTWSMRGNANVPPAQGFIGGPSGTVIADPSQPVVIEQSFGRSFLFNSTGNGTYSLHIDITWSSALVFDTLTVNLLYATVHLPAPGTALGLGMLGLTAARRRRPTGA